MAIAAVAALPIALLSAAPASAALPDQYIDFPSCEYDYDLGYDRCATYDLPFDVSPGGAVTLVSPYGDQIFETGYSADQVVDTTWTTPNGSTEDLPNAAISDDGTSVTAVLPTAFGYDVAQDPGEGTLAITVEDYTGTATKEIDVFPNLLHAPSAPGGVTAKRLTSTSATISWHAPADQGGAFVSRYIVKRSSSAGSWTASVSGAARSFTFRGLASGAAYNLSVRAENEVGRGTAAIVRVPGRTTTLNAPSSTTVVRTDDGNARITWAPPTVGGGKTIIGYKVARNGYDEYGHGAFSRVVSAGARSYTMHALVQGRTYTLSVQAIFSGGAGSSAKAGAFIG